jgi:hypothetical protein
MPPQRTKQPKYVPPSPIDPFGPNDPPTCSETETAANNQAKACNDLAAKIAKIINGDPNANPPVKGLEQLAEDCAELRDRTASSARFPEANKACDDYEALQRDYALAKTSYDKTLAVFIKRQAEYDKKYPECKTPPSCTTPCGAKKPQISIDTSALNLPNPNTNLLTQEITALENQLAELTTKGSKINFNISYIKLILETQANYGPGKKPGFPQFVWGESGLTITVTNQTFNVDSKFMSILNGMAVLAQNSDVLDRADLTRFIEEQIRLKSTGTQSSSTLSARCREKLTALLDDPLKKDLKATEDKILELQKAIKERQEKIVYLLDSNTLDDRDKKIFDKLTSCVDAANERTTAKVNYISYTNAAIESNNQFAYLPSGILDRGRKEALTTQGNTLNIDMKGVENILTSHFGKPVNCTENGPTPDGGPWTYPISMQVTIKTKFDRKKANECFDQFEAFPKLDYPGEDIDINTMKTIIRDAINALPEVSGETITCCKGKS